MQEDTVELGLALGIHSKGFSLRPQQMVSSYSGDPLLLVGAVRRDPDEAEGRMPSWETPCKYFAGFSFFLPDTAVLLVNIPCATE